MAGGIKSVQRGVTTFKSGPGANVTIAPVNLAKSFVLTSSPGLLLYSSAHYVVTATARLTSATNLEMRGTAAEAVDIKCHWEVVEFF